MHRPRRLARSRQLGKATTVKLRTNNQIELSISNARALIKAYEDKERGHASAYPLIYKVTDDGVIGVSIVSDEDHYTDDELASRLNPYAPPEAWAGVR